MAEVLGLNASIITVLQTTQSVLSVCYDYSAALKGSSWELTKVKHELEGFRTVVQARVWRTLVFIDSLTAQNDHHHRSDDRTHSRRSYPRHNTLDPLQGVQSLPAGNHFCLRPAISSATVASPLHLFIDYHFRIIGQSYARDDGPDSEIAQKSGWDV